MGVDRHEQRFSVPRNTRSTKKFTLMIGNPGVGKSTLLNALVGKPVFKSGTSYGKGLTQRLQLYQTPWGAWYGDTPGLADAVMRKAAAQEISKALKTQHGHYQLLFVVTEEAGRIRPADVTTIKLVLDALPKDRKVPYGIIINKVIKKIKSKLEGDSEAMKLMTACLNEGRDNQTAYIHLYAKDEELEGEDDKVHTPTSELKDFMQQVPFIEIKPEEVGSVRADEFEEQKRAARQRLQQRQEQLDTMRRQAQKAREVYLESVAMQAHRHQHEMHQAQSSAGCIIL